MSYRDMHDNHVVYCGWVWGALTLAGIQATPGADSAGDPTDEITLRLATGPVTLIVPPPPADWTPIPPAEASR